MNQEISKELIEKYLAGDALSKEELARMEEALQAKDDSLHHVIAAMRPETTWSEPLLEGIRFAGAQRLKKKLSIAAGNLEEEGFFLEEDDIEAWHKGELKGDKIAIFKKRLSEDAQFARKVEAEKNVLGSIRHYGEEQLKTKIENARKSLEAEGFFEEKEERQERSEGKIVPLSNRRRWLAVAAAAAVLLTAAIWLFTKRPPDVETLYAQNIDTYPDKISESIRSALNTSGYAAGSPEEIKWKELLTAMEAYPKAVSALESFLGKYPDEKFAQFYLAQAQLENGLPEAAKTHFEALENDAEFEERWAVKWYLALINLKQNNLSRSKELLEELKQSSPDYREKATRLLNKTPAGF